MHPQHSAAYDVIPVQVWTAQPDGALDYVNPGVIEYFCVARERILARGWQDLCHPLDLTHATERWTHALSTGEPYEVAFRLLRGVDRQYRWHVARATAVRDQNGAITHWVGTNTEIDWLKRAEEVGTATLARTRREHARWQAIFSQVPVAVIVTAGTGHRIELCSDAARVLSTQRELVGQPLLQAFPELAACVSSAQLDALYAGGTPIRTRPAAPGLHELACSPLRRDDGHIDGLIVVAS